jgi:Trk K+ transport system NAD-binding subunit
MAEGASRRVIVVGGDVLGRRLVQELVGLGATVAAVADGLDAGFADAARKQGATVVPGNPLDEDVLRTAGIDVAECLVAVSDSDSLNLEVGLTARKLAPKMRVIIRLVDAPIAARLERTFGIRSLNSAALAAPVFVSAALEGVIAASLKVEGMRIVVRGTAPEHGGAKGVAIKPEGPVPAEDDAELWVECEPEAAFHLRRRRAHKPKTKMRGRTGLLSALQRGWMHSPPIIRRVLVATGCFALLSEFVFWRFGGMSPLDSAYFVVTTMTTVGYGDINLQTSHPLLKVYGMLTMVAGAGLLATVYAIIADAVLSARLDYVLGRRGVERADHVVVIGLGKVGFRVAMEIRALGVDVVAIERRDDAENLQAARDHFPVVVGDASREEVLRLACLDSAIALIAVTNDGVLNLDVVLRAKQTNPDLRTVLRTHDPALINSFKELGLDAVASASTMSAPAFAAAALDPHVVASFPVKKHVMQLVKLPASEEGDGGSFTVLREVAPGKYAAADEAAGMDSGSVYALRVKASE